MPDSVTRPLPTPPQYRTKGTSSLSFILVTISAVGLWASEPSPSGQEVYKRLCAECHGAKGEGVEDRCPDPLQGDRSLPDLVKVIEETMPEDDPGKCTGELAEKVAEYIYGAFYSEEARAGAASRIELSHLTVRQYLNVTADLVAEFLGEVRLDEKRGLQGRYFNARNFRDNKKAFERLDPQIDFDFKAESPDPKKIGNEEFSIQWQGGVIAEETGDYEFYLMTENGARLWINGGDKPLIDAWVKSGDNTEYTASVRLLGGRVYPIRLEYFKFKEKTAAIQLQWRPPGRARQVIPQRNLSPNGFPPTLVVQTAFPPDDSSAGYERGTYVSQAWDRATTYAAVEIADKIVENLESLAKCKPDAPDREKRLKEFCHRFAERALRRPLSDEQKQFFIDGHFQDEGEPDSAVKKAVLLVLKSPRFLYLGLAPNGLDDYELASRLSFGLWDSLPDRELLGAAAQGKLGNPEEVARQARRMLADPRTKSKLRQFFHQWLKVKDAAEISKDKDLYPGFDEAVVSDLATSLDLFLDDVIWSEASDFRRLLLADSLFVNKRLAGFFGIEAPDGDGFHKVSLDPGKHAGILTHPYVMANFAYHKSTSPIHRGVFLVRSVLGRPLKPPPMAVAPVDEGVHPGLSTRQRVALQTEGASCQTCHSMINPLGFSLEHYDAVGRYRIEEAGKPIDASGLYQPASGEPVRLDGARELAEFLAASDEARRAVVAQLFHYLVKQPIDAYGPQQLENLEQSFAASEYSIRELLVEIMRTSALKTNGR